VLVSHAPGGWNAPRAFEELFDPAALAIPGVAAQVPRCSMIVMDLAHRTHAELLACSLPACQKLALWLLRESHTPAGLLASFDTWAPVLREAGAGTGAGQDRAGLDALGMLMGYMCKVSGSLWEALEAKLRKLGHHFEEAIMTTAATLHAEGLAEGLAQGHAQGHAQARIETLRDLLRYKFKTLDAATEARVQAATPAEIDRYFRRLLTAGSLAEVFESGSHRRALRAHPHGAHRARGRRASSSR
jgi:hypothetical protein